MINNIIKIAARIIFRNKIFSLINILGLSMGLACSILILSIIRQEMSFDKFHENADNIFCLQQTMDLGTGSYTTDRSGGACGPAVVDAIPEFSACVRLSHPLELLFIYYPADSSALEANEKRKFMEEGVLAVDSNFFSLFTFLPIAGNMSMALDDPYSIVLTSEMAEKYFGNSEPVGQYLNVNSKYEFVVTAVIEDPPLNSSISFDFLINFRFLAELGQDIGQFGGNPYLTFLYMDDPSLAAGMDSTINNIMDEHQSDGIDAVQKLLSLNEFHNKGENHGQYAIIIFTILAGIILAIACINFMNLSTARYLNRTREVGIRKVLGARRAQLIRQFIGETMIITFIALNLAILLIDLLLPLFNQFFETDVTFNLKDPVILVGLVLIFLVASLISGSYPAFFLSSFNPVIVLGKLNIGKSRGGGIRKALVVVQFLFTALFIIISIVNYKQYELMDKHRDEFDSENVIYLPARGEMNQKYAQFKQEILRNPGIENVTSAEYIPSYVESGDFGWGLSADDQNDIAMILPVNYDFGETFHIEMEEGRFYSPDNQSDSVNSIIINRKVADAIGLEEPLGQTFYLYGNAHTIIGIVKDYSFNPISLGGDKVIIRFNENNGIIFIRMKGQDIEPLIAYVEEVHEKYNPDYPFDHFFLDEFTDQITEVLGILNRVIYFFTFFGIFISCLGLLGLSIYLTEQRTKEIGIRKAVGASSSKILKLITLDFLKLVFISLVIAIPISILIARLMLQFFSDRVSMGPGLFLLTAVLLITLALITVSLQALRSAMSNPAENLRYE